MNELTIEMVREQAPAAFTETKASHLSDRYKPIQTIKLIEPLLENGWSVSRASQAQYRVASKGPHGYHILALTRPELKFNEGQVECLLMNSHNGSKKFEIKIGIFRMVCSNGIITQTMGFDQVTAKHFYDMALMIERSQQIIERAPKIIEKIEAWKALNLTDVQINDFEQYALQARYPKSNPEQLPVALSRINQCQRPQDVGCDLWRTFNRIQENIIRGGLPNLKGRVTRGIRSINRNVQLNEILWAGAEKLASGEPLFLLN